MWTMLKSVSALGELNAQGLFLDVAFGIRGMLSSKLKDRGMRRTFAITRGASKVSNTPQFFLISRNKFWRIRGL